MLNLTNGQLVFQKSGEELHQDILESMEGVARGLLRVLKLESLDLSLVTTKTHLAAAFPKFVLLHVLRQSKKFDKEYVEGVWKFHQTRVIDITPEQFQAVTLSEQGTEFAYKRSYTHGVNRGFGLFLIALHCREAITLPMHFDWPPGLIKAGIWSQDLGLFNELLCFLRLLDRETEELPHPAFSSVGTNKKRREWFLSYGTKLLLATGWQRPQDARLEDLLEIKNAENQLGLSAKLAAFKALIDVFRERYGKRFAITVEQWSSELSRSMNFLSPRHRGALTADRDGSSRKASRRLGMEINLEIGDADLLNEIIKASPTLSAPDALRSRIRLPGLSIDLINFAGRWLELQDVYKRTVKREAYKSVNTALGYLNIYLFFYLTYWFQRRPSTKFNYPDEPRKLAASLFVSRLLKPSDDDVPLTFVEYLEMASNARNWMPTTHYANLKQVEVFFEFLERHSDELPGCTGFRQPIPDYAYPPTARSLGTDKRPIPRRIFGAFMDYVEALKAYLEVVLNRIVNGELASVEVGRNFSPRIAATIDTFKTSSLTGFIPVLFTRDKTIPLQYIPNCLGLDWFQVAGGRRLKIPQPHALNQILVALYTGLRHNHIQWLDANTFDSEVTAEDHDFTLLLVNTDKQMRKPWTPHVNYRVIEVLRDQLAWRKLIDQPGFQNRQYYNDNPNTKWPPILSLFAADSTGRPHHDTRYSEVWLNIVSTFDALMPLLENSRLQQLSVLEPPGVCMNDPNARIKRQEYGKACERVCELRVKSRITPHSSRVTVVSQFTTLLPAEAIGKYITGQKPATIYYYTVIDPEDLQIASVHQSLQLREQAYRSKNENWGIAKPGSKQYIQADDLNSNLSRSLRVDLQETLVSYGCISITMNEGATSGLDILRETRASNAAENKTEICPYGNHCPPEVLKQWRGMHRCGLCQYAVRSVDHLPAVSAKVKEFDEILNDLTDIIQEAIYSTPSRYSAEELDRLDEERSRLAEELTGWRLSEEILDAARIRIAKGQDDRRWVVQKPEIILRDLKRVPAPSNMTAYLLMRLGECIAYPASESPQIRARFDILRRNVLARTGRIHKAFDPIIPTDPARECAGLLKAVVEANKLTYKDIVRVLEGDNHLDGLPVIPNLLLEGDSS